MSARAVLEQHPKTYLTPDTLCYYSGLNFEEVHAELRELASNENFVFVRRRHINEKTQRPWFEVFCMYSPQARRPRKAKANRGRKG